MEHGFAETKSPYPHGPPPAALHHGHESGRGAPLGPPTPVASTWFGGGASRSLSPVNMPYDIDTPEQSPTSSRGFIPPGFFSTTPSAMPHGFTPPEGQPGPILRTDVAFPFPPLYGERRSDADAPQVDGESPSDILGPGERDTPTHPDVPPRRRRSG